jgi:ribosomal protein L12E/L44/L45/RPP1/RPP2
VGVAASATAAKGAKSKAMLAHAKKQAEKKEDEEKKISRHNGSER